MEPAMLSVTDAAKVGGVGRDVLYQLMRIGRLQFSHVGKRRLIERGHLIEVLKQGATTEELEAGRKAA